MTYCGQGLPVRVNPARAGMIRSAAGSPERTERKPRASGDDPSNSFNTQLLKGVNPARAGMIPYRPPRVGRGRRKPRASGDDPSFLWARKEKMA